MSITRSIFKNLNEAESVKKTYGDKPQEGKTEKLQRGKVASIPKGKAEGKFKVEKLQNVNKEAGEIYANDTDKLMDKIDSKEQSDKGKVAKTTGTKADRTIKYPFGDKVDTPSDNKLIKESEEVAECDGANCEKKPLKESWISAQTMVEETIEEALHDEDLEDKDQAASFLEGIIEFVRGFADEHGIALAAEYYGECAKVEECSGKECK